MLSHAELLRDLRKIIRRAFEVLRRCARDHFQIGDLGQPRENLILHAFAEVSVVGIAAEIVEWQNRDRFVRNCSRTVRSRTGCIRRAVRARGRISRSKPRRRSRRHKSRRISSFASHVRHRVGCFGALNSLRRQLEHPGQNERDRQTENDEHDNQADRPVRNIEHGKHLRDSLRERPARDDVGDRNLVNIAPLQLGEEVVDLHFLRLCFSPVNFLDQRLKARRTAHDCHKADRH